MAATGKSVHLLFLLFSIFFSSTIAARANVNNAYNNIPNNNDAAAPDAPPHATTNGHPNVGAHGSGHGHHQHQHQLTQDYYAKSCPQMQQIVSDVMMDKQLSAQTTAAGTLRLFFHDCFVGGCDASVLVSTNSFNHAERDSDINLSLPGDAFDAVIRAKTKLELQCPGVVSCSDILALAARDLLLMLGGPFYRVPMGRKDSLTSTDVSVKANLPLPNMTITDIIARFTDKGFTVREMVALSGAHTVGFSHCKEFADRIFNFNGGGPQAFDPSMNPRFAQALQRACANYVKDPTMATFNDIMTPGKFDNIYYQNLGKGLGLLKSDQEMVSDPRTGPIVAEYAKDQDVFFRDFAAAMEKLGTYGVKMENNGEVRRRCDVVNNLNLKPL